MKHAIRHIHFVGMGGSGMSGIAEILLNLGYIVSGSDLASNAATQRLSSLGIRTFAGHAADNIQGADVLVTSTAIQASNPEVVAARAARIPVIPRALMLAELMRFRQGIAIAGKEGDPVYASADGRVMYAGSGLRGYGNLVLIKHNNTLLTVYAHNSALLVKEGQNVKKGQQIASMGKTDADRVKLHFEVRRNGKTVNPLSYLPAR